MTELGAVQVAVSANWLSAYLPAKTGGAGLQTVVLVVSPRACLTGARAFRQVYIGSVRVSPDRGRLAVATDTMSGA